MSSPNPRDSDAADRGGNRSDSAGGGGWEGPEARAGRERDPMAPPEEPCECFCLHCRRTFMSDGMWLQRVRGSRDGFDGFWMCPTPNCSGAGFGIDIHPTDPNHPENASWDDGDEEGEYDEYGEYKEFEEWGAHDDEGDEEGEWDPDESRYKALDEMCDDDDDLEGEEWKHGLQPGERPEVGPPPPGVEPRNWEEEEALYNSPDERPREVDWTDREYPPMTDDDIPF